MLLVTKWLFADILPTFLLNAVHDLSEGINGGPLANCRYVEALTALLVNINRVNKAETNIKIVGL